MQAFYHFHAHVIHFSYTVCYLLISASKTKLLVASSAKLSSSSLTTNMLTTSLRLPVSVGCHRRNIWLCFCDHPHMLIKGYALCVCLAWQSSSTFSSLLFSYFLNSSCILLSNSSTFLYVSRGRFLSCNGSHLPCGYLFHVFKIPVWISHFVSFTMSHLETFKSSPSWQMII